MSIKIVYFLKIIQLEIKFLIYSKIVRKILDVKLILAY